MTVNEIIKALECCYVEDSCPNCNECPIKNACDYYGVIDEVFSLINRQKVEIERLQMDNKQLQSDVINANQNWDHIKGLWECEKEKVDSAKQKVICACKMLKTAKSEAIKEFAERLCDGRVSNDPVVIAVKVELEKTEGI